MNKAIYTEGQMLWMVPTGNRYLKPGFVKIVRVGRVWLTLDNGCRANIDGLMLDGGDYMSPGACYLTKEEWETEKALSAAWNSFRSDVDRERRIPAGITVQSIIDARKILDLP